MVHPLDVALGFLLLAGIAGAILFVVAMAAFRRRREPAFAFLTVAFFLYAVKSLGVAYGLYIGRPEHELLELIDAVADAVIILLFVLPLMLRGKGHEA